MITAKTLQPFIYAGKVYQPPEILECPENIFTSLQSRGIVEPSTPSTEFTPAAPLPTLEEEQKATKAKKK